MCVVSITRREAGVGRPVRIDAPAVGVVQIEAPLVSMIVQVTNHIENVMKAT